MIVVLSLVIAPSAPASAAGTGEGAGAWKAVPSPSTSRTSDQTATQLRDGRILVVGGLAAGDYSKAALTEAELYDPATDQWVPTGSLARPRQYHQATLMSDGKVLVTGGYFEQKLVTAVEIFDPVAGSWSTTADMPIGRMGHTATLLPDGKMLVAGGLVFGPDARFTYSNSAQLYDPANGKWLPAEDLPAARAEHTATLLGDGTVLLLGGHNSVGTSVAALRDGLIYTPATGTWATVPHLMGTARAAHTATLLNDGSVLIAGGSLRKQHGGTGNPTPLVELYRPKTSRFVPAPPLRSPRLAHSATLLGDDRVLVVGGVAAENNRRLVQPVGSAELYDPATRKWSPTAAPPNPPSAAANREMRVWLLGGNHSATLLAGNKCGPRCGQVLVIGGDQPAASARLYIPPAARAPGAGKAAPAGDDTGGQGRGVPILVASLIVVVGLGLLIAKRARRGA